MNFSNALNIFKRSARLTKRYYFTHPEYKHLMEPFQASYPELKKYFLENVEGEQPKRVVGEALDYQLDVGRFLRAAITLKVYEAMKLPYPEPKTMHTAHAMAWIPELVQAPAIIEDDIADNSSLRRGKTPYHIGKSQAQCMIVARWLTEAPHLLLNGWLGKYPCFESASKILTEYSLSTSNFQLIDSAIINSDIIRSKNISWEFYKDYCVFKANYCSELPFRLGAYAARRSDLPFDNVIDDILEDVAHLVQAVNDSFALAIDSSAPPGKDLDEDIIEKKFTFVPTYLMNNATDQDKDIIADNYGDVKIMREMIEKYKVAEGFQKYKNDLSNSIDKKIEGVSNEHKLQDGLIALHETVKAYPASDAVKKKLDV